MPKYRISDVSLDIAAPEWALHDNLESFLWDTGDTETRDTETRDTDVYCEIIFKKRPTIPGDEAQIMAKTPGTTIYKFHDDIHNLSGDDKDIPSYTVAAKNWSCHTMLVDPDYNNPNDHEIARSVRDGLFAALRSVLISALAQKRGLIIHSCTILWQGEGVMFSAPSGIGKSTHAHLWQQLYKTPILDGDATACRMVQGVPIVYGLPWCGTSGEFINQRVPLGAIVFLQQANENRIEKLDLSEATLRLTARCFLLPWTHELMNQFLDTVQEIAENVDCYLLNCRPDSDAVELVKTCLEMKKLEMKKLKIIKKLEMKKCP